jgi:hypothetical protein
MAARANVPRAPVRSGLGENPGPCFFKPGAALGARLRAIFIGGACKPWRASGAGGYPSSLESRERLRTALWARRGTVTKSRRLNKRINAPHVRFYRWMLDSPAYLSLSCPARAVLIEIAPCLRRL